MFDNVRDSQQKYLLIHHLIIDNDRITCYPKLFLYLRIWLIIYPTCQKRLRSTHQQIFCPTPTPPLLDVQDYKWPYHHHQPEDNSLIRILLTQLEHLKFKKFHNIYGKLEIKFLSKMQRFIGQNTAKKYNMLLILDAILLWECTPPPPSWCDFPLIVNHFLDNSVRNNVEQSSNWNMILVRLLVPRLNISASNSPIPVPSFSQLYNRISWIILGSI